MKAVPESAFILSRRNALSSFLAKYFLGLKITPANGYLLKPICLLHFLRLGNREKVIYNPQVVNLARR